MQALLPDFIRDQARRFSSSLPNPSVIFFAPPPNPSDDTNSSPIDEAAKQGRTSCRDRIGLHSSPQCVSLDSPTVTDDNPPAAPRLSRPPQFSDNARNGVHRRLPTTLPSMMAPDATIDSSEMPGIIAAPPSTSAHPPEFLSVHHHGIKDTAGPLPEDDGLGELRRRIFAIQALDISTSEKARLMHELLNEGYNRSRRQVNARHSHKCGAVVCKQTIASGPLESLMSWSPFAEALAPQEIELTEADLAPTYAPPSSLRAEGLDEEEDDDDQAPSCDAPANLNEPKLPLGCKHYRRNVKMQCVTCEQWYTCRLCHDEVEDHVLPRHETKHMLCMLCSCAQRVSDTCLKCGESAARYYCAVCKLWNDDPDKSIYHCDDCGICRVGAGLGKDFTHCKKCCACIGINVADDHPCIERAAESDCPICGDFMFTSCKRIVFMKCGHSIHAACFDQYRATSYKCPICSKSIVNMEFEFRNMDLILEAQVMPVEYCDARAVVYCNDCSAKSQTGYHWLGLKCSICNSYNTVALELLGMPQRHDDNPERLVTLELGMPPHAPAAPPNMGLNLPVTLESASTAVLAGSTGVPRSLSITTLAELELPVTESASSDTLSDDSNHEDILGLWGHTGSPTDFPRVTLTDGGDYADGNGHDSREGNLDDNGPDNDEEEDSSNDADSDSDETEDEDEEEDEEISLLGHW